MNKEGSTMDESNKHGNPVRAAFQKLLQNKLATVCFVVLILEILLVALAPFIAPYGYEEQDPAHALAPGFWAQWTAVTDLRTRNTTPGISMCPAIYWEQTSMGGIRSHASCTAGGSP